MTVDGNLLMQLVATMSSFACIIYVFTTIRSDINSSNKTRLDLILEHQLKLDNKMDDTIAAISRWCMSTSQVEKKIDELTILINDNKRPIEAHTSAFNDFYSKLKEIEDLSKESVDLNKTAFKMYITGGKDKVIAQEMSQRVDGIIQGVVSYEDESKKNSKKS